MFPALLLALTLAIPATPRQDGVQVRADLSARTTAAGAPVSFIVTATIPGRGTPVFSTPRFDREIRVVGTYTSQETQIMMPGGRQTVVRQEYRIVAAMQGEYTMPSVIVRVDGVEYRTRPVELTVLPSSSRDSDTPVRLETTLTPPTAYVGQQLVLGMAAIMPLNSRTPILRGPSFDPPKPDGFWIQDLPERITIETDVIDGEPVEVQTYRGALFPLSAGRFTIPAGRIVYETRRAYMGSSVQETTGDSMTVTVIPLPAEGRPAAFSGAVGRYTVAGSIDRTSGAAGDAFTYTLQIEGEGNIKALQPPSFPDLDGVEVYPPSEDATLRVVNARIGGVRTFQWVLIPRKDGPVVVPPITYTWFDPSSGHYEGAATDPVALGVTPAAAARGSDTTLAPLRVSSGRGIADWTRSRTFLLLNVIPLITLLAALTLRAQRGSAGNARRQQRAALQQRARALDAAVSTAEPRAFLGDAIRLVDDVRTHSDDDALRARCDALTTRMRATLYAADAPTQDTIRRANADLQDLVRVALRGKRWPSAASATGIVVTLMIGASAVAYADARTDFANAVAAYQRADHATAVSHFTRYVAQAPDDAAGWYDLGVAEYRAGDPGRAIWAWLRAYEHSPRARDVAHNLAVANAGEAAAAKSFWVPLSSAELRIVAAVCWWLLLLVLSIHVLRPARTLRIAAIVFLVAGVAAGGGLIARGMAADLVVPFGRGAALYAGPTSRTESVGRLEAGGSARVVRRENEWLLVRSPSLLEGWVRASDVGIL
ncbi:MAG TPA: BatD family protein [Longimicrobiales bacterium]